MSYGKSSYRPAYYCSAVPGGYSGRDFKQHTENLRVVFSRLHRANLKLNPDKCNLLRREVKYLGRIVSTSGIAPNPDNVRAVMSWSVPLNTTQVKSFIGLTLYYRQFIANFTDTAAP